MNSFDRFFIAPISPGWALRRERARLVLQAMQPRPRNFYEAADQPARMRKARTDRGSANAVNQRAIVALRVQARHLEENFDVASGALDIMESNVVGSGIQPEPQVMLNSGEAAKDLNEQLLELWDDWIYSPEVTRQQDYYSLQRLACRSWIRDGEVFGKRLTGAVPFLDHNTVVPYSLEMLEADFVPVELTDQSRGIIQGIQHNAWGQPRNYHVYKLHPGGQTVLSVTTSDTKMVPAENMFHLKLVKRLHQVRGVSAFAPVLNRLDDLKEVDESERVAARVAAAMTGFIKKGVPDDFTAAEVGADGKPELRTMELVPGAIFDDLQPGEDVGTIASNRPNNGLIPFRDSMLRSFAAGFGVSFSSASKNYDGTYSAQRQELVEQYVNYRKLSGQFIFRVCQPIWDGFVDAILASGAVTIAGNVDRKTLYNCTHTVPQMPWIDPESEVNANKIAQQQGYKSRSRIIRETGQNPDQVNREIQRDQAETERLGLELGEPAPAAPGFAPDRNAPADPPPGARTRETRRR